MSDQQLYGLSFWSSGDRFSFLQISMTLRVVPRSWLANWGLSSFRFFIFHFQEIDIFSLSSSGYNVVSYNRYFCSILLKFLITILFMFCFSFRLSCYQWGILTPSFFRIKNVERYIRMWFSILCTPNCMLMFTKLKVNFDPYCYELIAQWIFIF